MPESGSSFLTQQLPTAAGMLGAMAVRSAMTKAYAKRKGHEPPLDPGAEGATWGSAIAWTAVLAAGAAVGRLLARYVVAEQVDKRVAGRRELKPA
jgi:hypothetical protein